MFETKAAPKAIDWARLAAYIDGEGTVYINSQQPTHRKGGPGAKLSAETITERENFSQKIRDLNSKTDPLEIVQ